MSNQQAIDELRPEFAAVRPKLAALQPVVDAAAPRTGALAELQYDANHEERVNVSFVRYDQLTDPDTVDRDGAAYIKRFDLVAGGLFLYCLQFTGDKNPMTRGATKKRDGKALLARCRQALGVRFVVVVKTLRSVVPRLVSVGHFAGGATTVEISVVDWGRNEVVSKFTVEGVPDQVVKYTLRPGDAEEAAAALRVHSSMWVDVRAKIKTQLVAQGAHIEWH